MKIKKTGALATLAALAIIAAPATAMAAETADGANTGSTASAAESEKPAGDTSATPEKESKEGDQSKPASDKEEPKSGDKENKEDAEDKAPKADESKPEDGAKDKADEAKGDKGGETATTDKDAKDEKDAKDSKVVEGKIEIKPSRVDEKGWVAEIPAADHDRTFKYHIGDAKDSEAFVIKANETKIQGVFDEEHMAKPGDKLTITVFDGDQNQSKTEFTVAEHIPVPKMVFINPEKGTVRFDALESFMDRHNYRVEVLNDQNDVIGSADVNQQDTNIVSFDNAKLSWTASKDAKKEEAKINLRFVNKDTEAFRVVEYKTSRDIQAKAEQDTKDKAAKGDTKGTTKTKDEIAAAPVNQGQTGKLAKTGANTASIIGAAGALGAVGVGVASLPMLRRRFSSNS